MDNSLPPAGWYPDPAGNTGNERYWDGEVWTDQLRPIVARPVMHTSTYDRDDSTLYLIAFIFMVLATVGMAAAVIPLAWMIPMTVHTYKIYKGTKPNTVGFAVCTLIFCGVVSGILLLVAEKDN